MKISMRATDRETIILEAHGIPFQSLVVVAQTGTAKAS
jgi:hypothetical protein